MPAEQENGSVWSVIPFKTSRRGPRLSVEGGARQCRRGDAHPSTHSRAGASRRSPVTRWLCGPGSAAGPLCTCLTREYLQTRHFPSV